MELLNLGHGWWTWVLSIVIVAVVLFVLTRSEPL